MSGAPIVPRYWRTQDAVSRDLADDLLDHIEGCLQKLFKSRGDAGAHWKPATYARFERLNSLREEATKLRARMVASDA